MIINLQSVEYFSARCFFKFAHQKLLIIPIIHYRHHDHQRNEHKADTPHTHHHTAHTQRSLVSIGTLFLWCRTSLKLIKLCLHSSTSQRCRSAISSASTSQTHP